MLKGIEGRRVLITGATGAFGSAVARKFCREGGDVLLTGRSRIALEQLAHDLKGEFPAATTSCLTADLSSESGQSNLIDAMKDWGTDVLINAAAVQGPIGRSWENDWALWKQAFEINLYATIALCRAVVPGMAAKGRGKIINFSGGGATAPRANFSSYACAKTAIVRYSECLAVETQISGIDVNCVAPGAARTRMTQAILDAAGAAGEAEVTSVERATEGSPRILERAAGLCAYLASKSGDGITGRLISAVWDPWDRLHEKREELRTTDVYTLRRIVPNDRGLNWDS